jgi:hypothetical protein
MSLIESVELHVINSKFSLNSLAREKVSGNQKTIEKPEIVSNATRRSG